MILARINRAAPVQAALLFLAKPILGQPTTRIVVARTEQLHSLATGASAHDGRADAMLTQCAQQVAVQRYLAVNNHPVQHIKRQSLRRAVRAAHHKTLVIQLELQPPCGR